MLVVEAVAKASPAETLDIRINDHLLAYNDQRLLSSADLLALEENTFGAQQLVLRIMRAGIESDLSIPTGKLGLIVRLELTDDVQCDYDRGRKAFAAEQFAEAAQHWREAAERASEKTVSVWLYTKAGEAWEKVPGWQQAREIYTVAWEQTQGEEGTAEQSQIASALGKCSDNLNDYETAVQWYKQAQQLNETAKRPLWVASALNSLGAIAFQRGDLQAAQDYFSRALKIRERLAPDSLVVAASHNNLGNVALERGDLQAAQDYFSRALQITERRDPASLDVSWSLNNLGIVACQQGDLQAAQDYFRRALTIKEHFAPGSLDVAMSICNLGTLAWHRGDLQAAQDDYTRALQISERLAPGSLDVASSLNNLGLVARDRGDLLTAQDCLARALQIRGRLAPDSLDVARSLDNLGLVARDRGDLEAAHDYYTRALQTQERFAPASLDVAASLTNLGLVAMKLGDPAMAQDYHLRALTTYARLAPGSLNQASILSDLGQTFLRQQQPHQALPYLQQAVQILEKQRSIINSPEARALLLAQHTPVYAGLIQCQLARDNADEAFSTLERTRARSLRELLVERRLDFTAEAPLDLLQQQQELDRQRAHTYDQLARVSAAEGEQEIQAMHVELRDIERQQQQLTTQIRQTSPRYASLQYPQPLDCQAAQHALQPGTLLLAFVTAEEQTFLFALTNNTLHTYTLDIDLKSLQKQVRNFRAALNIGSMEYSLEEVVAHGKNLYDRLLAQAQAQIGEAKCLLLCPDGPLHTLPWAALVTNTDDAPRYLGECKPLHTTLSMTVYAQMREESVKRQALSVEDLVGETDREEGRGRRGERATADAGAAPSLTSRVLHTSRKLLAFGDPIYTRSAARPRFALVGSRSVQTGEPSTPDIETQEASTASSTPSSDLREPELVTMRTRGLTLEPLPHTRKELEGLARLFGPRATVRLGAEATKTAALQESAEMDILHFACHGWLDSQAPLSSGLILSQPELLGESAPEGDNGLLQAWEIFSKMRLKAELVVLSACQTALGQEVRGEGLMGLTRAFTYAGARSVLTSLWEINDASTSAFMQSFYSALAAGQDKAESLQSAMQQMRRHPQWADPFFWSAFLLAGDAD